MAYNVHPEKGMINRGNWYRIKKCMKKALQGEKITVGFLGGSITQGSLSSTPETCYAYLVYEWWKNKFPKSEITFINAGIGGTTSQFGVSRVEEHLLKYNPDFVLIEFAVNDDNTEFFAETYEGLVRRTLGDKCSPALMLMNNVRYDNGVNAQEMHLKVAKAYELPMVSMKSTIWPEVESGRIPNREITPDDLHPNDAGHKLVAQVITAFLEDVYEGIETEEKPFDFGGKILPDPITANAYEKSVRYQNFNSSPETKGFAADKAPQSDIRDVFRNGWTAWKTGDKITFTFDCTGVAVQYRKSVKQPTCVAKAVVDGRENEAVILDGNFDEDWGDCLYIDTVTKHMEPGKHTVEITIIESHDKDVVPFYLVSVIGSDS
ncbi:MAG: SGNH/GDSL hydrolase family protein [Lachnospiraceae bacterium]|nr:SGNH/GDSL hydrolase family protein [Lachnospiraceae bacterium]